MVRIGIDADGGDNGAIEVVKAVINALKENSELFFKVLGDNDNIASLFKTYNFDLNDDRVEIINCSQKIEMNDHPVFALRSKSDSSIYKAIDLLKNNEIDLFISAGNTGALVAMAQLYLKPIKGIDRPVVAAIAPTNKKPVLLIDSGCNLDSKPEWLYQYALLGNEYYKLMYGIDSPKIALLSVGTEENKGNTLTLVAYKLLKENDKLNFVGNVEARDIPEGICDILITDGFAGNVFLKTYEGTAKMLLSVLKEVFYKNTINKIAALILKSTLKTFMGKFDAKIYGGAPILGANYLVLKCHGNATNVEYSYAIKQAVKLVNENIMDKINKSIEEG